MIECAFFAYNMFIVPFAIFFNFNITDAWNNDNYSSLRGLEVMSIVVNILGIYLGNILPLLNLKYSIYH